MLRATTFRPIFALSPLRRSNRNAAAPAFIYQKLFDPTPDNNTEYMLLRSGPDFVKTIDIGGQQFLRVEPEALRLLTATAMTDINHLLRPSHLQQLSNILKDPESTKNDKFVAFELLKNANIAANFVLPSCQDTGTAIVMGKRGHQVLTDGDDEVYIAKGVYDTYTGTNLRYSQVAPLTMYEEVNTKTNLPAQIDIHATKGNEYHFLFIAKGGGSANKTFLYQQTKALLNPTSLMKFLDDNIKTIGTSACPPYHLAIVIGGLSAELTLKTVKLASTKYYDELPTSGNNLGRAFRDIALEDEILKLTQSTGDLSAGFQINILSLVRDRSSVWRQVFLPRCASHKTSKTWSFLPCRDRSILLRRPPGESQNNCRWSLYREAGERCGEVPSRCH